MITLECNYQKKLGLPGYSSHQFAITLRTEIADLNQVQSESARLYKLLQDGVDNEAGGHQNPPRAAPLPQQAVRHQVGGRDHLHRGIRSGPKTDQSRGEAVRREKHAYHRPKALLNRDLYGPDTSDALGSRGAQKEIIISCFRTVGLQAVTPLRAIAGARIWCPGRTVRNTRRKNPSTQS
jgi:hypothetical protein